MSLLAILVLSLVPGEFRPHTMILPPGFEHVAAYAVAAFFLGLACSQRLPPMQLVLLLTSYGALLELGQLWVPGRHGQLSDVGADLAGASIGVMVALACGPLASRPGRLSAHEEAPPERDQGCPCRHREAQLGDMGCNEASYPARRPCARRPGVIIEG
jgi:hypothetical protein